jgi:NAD(P)H-dependent FMN reductase
VPELLLISGSTRPASTNTAVLRTLAAVAPDTVTTTLYGDLAELPAFVPETSPELAAVTELRAAIASADLVVVCTPEYAGTLPGSLKNLLDWTVGTADLYEKPVAWINAAATGRGDGAEATLRLVLGYVGAEIVGTLRVEMPSGSVGPDGLIAGDRERTDIAAFAAHLVRGLPRVTPS